MPRRSNKPGQRERTRKREAQEQAAREYDAKQNLNDLTEFYAEDSPLPGTLPDAGSAAVNLGMKAIRALGQLWEAREVVADDLKHAAGGSVQSVYGSPRDPVVEAMVLQAMASEAQRKLDQEGEDARDEERAAAEQQAREVQQELDRLDEAAEVDEIMADLIEEEAAREESFEPYESPEPPPPEPMDEPPPPPPPEPMDELPPPPPPYEPPPYEQQPVPPYEPPPYEPPPPPTYEPPPYVPPPPPPPAN